MQLVGVEIALVSIIFLFFSDIFVHLFSDCSIRVSQSLNLHKTYNLIVVSAICFKKNKRFELCWLTYKQTDFQVFFISGLSCRRDKTFVFFNVKNCQY